MLANEDWKGGKLLVETQQNERAWAVGFSTVAIPSALADCLRDDAKALKEKPGTERATILTKAAAALKGLWNDIGEKIENSYGRFYRLCVSCRCRLVAI
ncbi:unnamed protein product [Amoebophrya sp. A25]|nr:unnamed protein product [Amoebophrya sp. A25]|eukprot:GSA25T00006282001.1